MATTMANEAGRSVQRVPSDVGRCDGLAVVGKAALCTLLVTPLLRWAVVAYSVPVGRPLRRRCPRCASPLGPAGDLGALTPSARCGMCWQRMGPAPWALELVVVVSAGGLAWSGITGLALAAYGWWAAIGVVLLFVDVAVRRLPARLSYVAASGLLVLLLMDAYIEHDWTGWVRAVLGALVAVVAVGASALVAPRLVHWGDVRYALAVGAAAAWVGWLVLYVAAFVASLFAAMVGIGLIVVRRATLTTHLPQGPFLYAGTLLSAVVLHR